MVDRSPQFEKALQGLRTLVMARDTKPGARLSEVALAAQLGTSRTPIRQAMERLVDEGLLIRNKTGGCRIARLAREDVIDAIELRGVLEGTAARLAAERGADPNALADATDAICAIETALNAKGDVDFEAYVSGNAEFHLSLARMSRSAVITRELDRANRLPFASPSAFLNGQKMMPDFRASLHRAQHQHLSIIDAIKSREGARAEALAREHARLARANLDFLTRVEPDLAKGVPGLALVAAV